ncbi:uncharacterized protein LOC126775302 [Nymphalis io]|uniref:uncharacterized protein LOC126775302 n=1 Tax=Inachis io TaxID=171585 RepID=UPI0021688FB8|nr:uncharacterized protein LOC126775302 [Nymphalis io]
MCRYVAIVALAMVELMTCAPPPLRVTIDCGSDEDPAQYSNSRSAELFRSNSHFDVDSFCNFIHNAIPQVVKDGKFVVEPDLDQEGLSDSLAPVAVAPPSGFIPKLVFPKLRPPRLRTPTLNTVNVPKLRPFHGTLKPPKIGSPMSFPSFRYEEQSSAERLEKFKKGVQKMLHFVKVLGKIDQYISERTRIVIDKLTKTFLD